MRRRNLLVMLFLAVSLLAVSQSGTQGVLANNTNNSMCSTAPAQASECTPNSRYVPLERIESSSPADAGQMQPARLSQPEPLVQPEPLISNDPYVEKQWALSKIGASRLWESTTGSRDVLVAVLDTGIDKTHEDLNGLIIGEADFTDNSSPGDVYGHGTHVAGIIAAKDDGVGIVGVAPECRLLSVKVADDTGGCQAQALAKGIVWAASSGASVINVSIEIREPSPELEEAVNYAWSHGSLVVAAAGNSGSESPVYPASYENCIAVTATRQDDSLAPLSNHGDWVDVAAPGFDIYSTLPDNSYGHKTGTSFATAYVSGMAALLFDMVTDTNDDGRRNDEVRAAIEAGCQEIDTGGVGSGRIDVAKAVARVFDAY